MNAKLSIYPGIQREAVSFFYKEYELFQVADISMLRGDVIACFECREISAGLQCKFKIFVVGTNNRGVHAEEIVERGTHHHCSYSKMSLMRAKYRMWMVCAVELDLSSTYEQLHHEVLTSMRLNGNERGHILPIDAAFREVLKHRRDGARLRGWSLGWDRHSIEQTLTAANRDEFRRSALSRQLRSMFHHQEREVPVVVVNLEDPAMDVVQELAPVDGNGETLSVSDIAREAQGIGGRLPTAAVVHVLGCSTKDLPTPVQCCLCLGPRPTVAIVGCGHVCVCSDCCRKKTLALHFCPICRGGLVTKNRNLILQNIF